MKMTHYRLSVVTDNAQTQNVGCSINFVHSCIGLLRILCLLYISYSILLGIYYIAVQHVTFYILYERFNYVVRARVFFKNIYLNKI